MHGASTMQKKKLVDTSEKGLGGSIVGEKMEFELKRGFAQAMRRTLGWMLLLDGMLQLGSW